VSPRRYAWVALTALLGAACNESFENAPRVTPAAESLWLLVGFQMKLDGARTYLIEHPGVGSVSPQRIDRLSSQVLATCEYLTSRAPSDDELRAARYRVDLIALGWGVIQADVLASAGGIGGVTHAATLHGLGWVEDGFKEIELEPLFVVKKPREAQRILLMAVSHRDNTRRSIPASAVMHEGANAAAMTSGAVATARLMGAGASILARVLGFAGEAGGGPVLVTAGFAGGVGSMQVLAAGRTLVLTTEEVIALTKAGVISATALAVYMAVENLHHICTDKNTVSDKQGGPWTPRFEDYFKKAGMTFQDSENLVRVKAHRGPHPAAYHLEVDKVIQREVKDLRAGTAEYREGLKRALARLAKAIQTPGTRLNQLVTGVITE